MGKNYRCGKRVKTSMIPGLKEVDRLQVKIIDAANA
jgi:hypothetical protein